MTRKKIKIAIVILGHSNLQFEVKNIKNIGSNIFEVTSLEEVSDLPETNLEDGYLDQKFERAQIGTLIKCPDSADIALGIMSYRFNDNFYMHRVGKNCAVVSLYGIDGILDRKSISMDNFIKKQLYEITALYLLCNDLISDDVYKLVHRDTKGCLFDLNGDRQDIIYNTETPIICEACKSKFRKIQIEGNILELFQKELKNIRKPLIQRLERAIQKYPLISITISAMAAILLNLAASAIWEKIK
jgi:hypothetical protein